MQMIKLNWSIFGALMGVVGVVLALIFGYFTIYPIINKPVTAISFNVVEANVLDVYKPIDNLTILFRVGDVQEDIQKSGRNLQVITLRVKNTGDTDILQSHYEQSDPWGFRVENATIVGDPRVLRCSSNYLKCKAKQNIRLIDERTVELPKVILERDKYYTIEILVIHERDARPTITPLGKIAGIDKVGVVYPANDGSGKHEELLPSWIAFVSSVFAALVAILMNVLAARTSRRRRR